MYVYVTRKNDSRIELYIDKGLWSSDKNTQNDNIKIFNYLYKYKNTIES